MSNHPTTLQVFYKDQAFRNHLDARWAVFFSALGAKWEYFACDGSQTEGSQHTPDFFITMKSGHGAQFEKAGYWVFIKSLPPTEADLHQVSRFCAASDHHGYMFYGMPGENSPFNFNNLHSKAGSRGAPKKATFPELSAIDATFHSAVLSYALDADKEFDTLDLQQAIDTAKSFKFSYRDRQ